jgi:hypothetical protein
LKRSGTYRTGDGCGILAVGVSFGRDWISLLAFTPHNSHGSPHSFSPLCFQCE